MKKLTSFQIKLILAVLIFLIAIIGIFLFMLNSKTTVNGNINITKIETKDKIYTYDIFSDFYYNIAKYDDKGVRVAQFSQLIPTKTSIGFDFSSGKPELIITPFDNFSEIQLISNNDIKLSREIDIIKKFSKEFSKISTIQDEHYFKENIKNTYKIIENIYGVKNEFDFKSLDNFYEKNISTLVSNINIKTPKLDEINKNINNFEVCQNKEWCSSLVKWEFGDGDNISLFYVTRLKEIDLDKYVEDISKSTTITKMTKINNSQVTRFLIVKPDNVNELRSYYMDTNGYVYLLKYKYKNPKSLEKYQNDYIKIAYGLSFIDVLNFENKYAKIEDDLNEYKDTLSDINKLDVKLKNDLLEHFNLKSNAFLSTNLKLVDIFNTYEKDSNYLNVIKKELEDKKLLKEAILALPNGIVNAASKGIQFIYEKPIQFLTNTLSKDELYKNSVLEEKKFEYYSSRLKGLCSDIDCVKNLKANEWKVEDKK